MGWWWVIECIAICKKEQKTPFSFKTCLLTTTNNKISITNTSKISTTTLFTVAVADIRALFLVHFKWCALLATLQLVLSFMPACWYGAELVHFVIDRRSCIHQSIPLRKGQSNSHSCRSYGFITMLIKSSQIHTCYVFCHTKKPCSTEM